MSTHVEKWDERWHIERENPPGKVVWEIVVNNDMVIVRSPRYGINVLRHPFTDKWREELHALITTTMKGRVFKVEMQYEEPPQEAAAQ